MHSFEAQDRRFELELTIGKCRKFRSRLDLIDSPPDELVEALLTKPYLRLDLMWLMCVPQDGVKQSDFDDLMTGEVGKEAEAALRNELLFFTRSIQPARAKLMERALTEAKKLIEMEADLVDKLVSSPEAVKAMEEVMAKAESNCLTQYGNLSTKLQEQLESTPTP